LGGPALTVALVSVETVDHGFRLTLTLQELKSAVDGWNTEEIVQNAFSSQGLNTFPPMTMPVAGKLQNAFRVDGHICVMSEARAILLPASEGTDEQMIYQIYPDKWKQELFKKPSSLREFRNFWDRKPVVLSFNIANQAGDKILLARKNGSNEVLAYNLGNIDFSN
jgi:hypothetical protein